MKNYQLIAQFQQETAFKEWFDAEINSDEWTK
jgi:hypothetical protein